MTDAPIIGITDLPIAGNMFMPCDRDMITDAKERGLHGAMGRVVLRMPVEIMPCIDPAGGFIREKQFEADLARHIRRRLPPLNPANRITRPAPRVVVVGQFEMLEMIDLGI